MEKARWGDGFVCPHCHAAGDPFRIATRPGVLRCRKCRHDTGLTVGTVMERSHMPLRRLFGRQPDARHLGGSVSATARRAMRPFGILHKLRAGMVRPNQDRIGGKPGEHVEIDETWVGGRTRGEGRGVHHKVLVACAVEVRHRKPGTAQDKRKDGRYAGRVRLAVVPDRSADSLCGFVESAVAPRTLTVTDDWSGYASLGKRGYEHFARCRVRRPRGCRGLSADHPSRLRQSENVAHRHPSRCQPSASFKPISMSSRSALTGASTHSTPSAPSSASLAMSAHRPSMNSIQGNGSTLHVVGECVNRIGKGSC